MGNKIFTFELTYLLKRPAVYLYSLAFSALAFVSFAGTAGFFDPPTVTSGTPRLLNSPHEINYILLYFNKLMLFLLPAIIGNALYRDYQTQMYTIMYTFPLRKWAYLGGKFLGAFSLVVGVALAAGVAMWLAEWLPGLDRGRLGPIRSVGYRQAYGLFVLPNLLAHGLLVFAAVLRWRNNYAGFAVVIGLLLLQTILENLLVNEPALIALTDPFGQNTVQYLTRYWTLAEQNSLRIPVNRLVLANRLLWLALSGGLFWWTARWFSFSEMAGKGSKSQLVPTTTFDPPKVVDKPVATNVAFNFSVAHEWKAMLKIARFDFKFMVRSWSFIGLLTLGLAAVLFILLKVTNRADATLLPATYLVLTVPALFYGNIVLLLTFVYTGMLVHRERTAAVQQLVDISPLPGWVFLLGKTRAILKMQLLLLVLFIGVGVSVQAANGYFNFETGLYLFHLLVLVFPYLGIWALAAFFVHTLVPHVYAGIFILLLGWLGIGALANAGVNAHVLFNYHDPLTYSDLNGYGHQLAPYLYLKLFWLLCGLLLLVLSSLLWVRGWTAGFAERLKAMKQGLSGPLLVLSALLVVSLVTVGWDLWQKEKSSYPRSEEDFKTAFQQFERQYQRYAGLPQPNIKGMVVTVDFFPAQHSFVARGRYRLVNETGVPIDTLLVKAGFDERTLFALDRANEIVRADTLVQFYVIKLEDALLAGDSLALDFTVRNQPNTFFVRNANVLDNGSFIRQDAFPRVGYFLDSGAKDPRDATSRMTHYQGTDADRLTFDAVVSTTTDQVALAPGYLDRTWTINDRQYFHYRLEEPIKYGFSFHSGKYKVAKKQWHDVALEVYHHPTHGYNLASMFQGLAAALDYNTRYFTPYQHRTASVVEFPNSEGSFGTSFANRIPLSEARFIAHPTAHHDKINLPFYVPAHELTHQWWGNQLVPANADGALLLTESITEYITLNIYRNSLGEASALDFLAQQRWRYLTGRSTAQAQEPPLVYVKPTQQYIAYGKGAVAFHALAHFLGEDKLNGVLREFLLANRFKGAPYPTSLDLLERLHAQTPDSLQYLLRDYFEQVVLHTASLRQAAVTKTAANSYLVEATVAYQKTDRNGQPLENALLADYVEIGCYDAAGRLYDTHVARITRPAATVRFTVTQKPAELRVDPNLLLLEVNRDDNSWLF